MQYVIIARDYPNGFEKRQQHRAAHLEGAEQLKKEGKLLYAVALVENGQMKGSIMVMNFNTRAELDAYKAKEPYITGGVWESVEISECAVPPLFS